MKLAAALAALAVSLAHAQTPTDAATAFVARVLQAAIAQTARAFSAYPRAWGLSRPDPNIDHRRVPNLQTYFRRRGAQLDATRDPRHYLAGDLVTWMLPGNLPHIGLITDLRSADGLRPLVVHNVGNGPEVEDMLFRFPISGHYRYRGQ